MSIKSFYLSNFKSIKDAIYIEFKKNLNLLLGLNGSGKSNILQALSLLNVPDQITYDDYANEDNMDKNNAPITIGLTFKDFLVLQKPGISNIFNYVFINMTFWYPNQTIKFKDSKILNPIFAQTNTIINNLCDILSNKLFINKLQNFTFYIGINKNNTKYIKLIFEDDDLIKNINKDPTIVGFINENAKLSNQNKCLFSFEDNRLVIKIETNKLSDLSFDINSFINIKILKNWEKELPTSLTWDEYKANSNKYSFYKNLISKIANLDIDDIQKLKNDEQLRYKCELKIKEKFNDFLSTYWDQFNKNKKIIVRLDETKISILVSLKNDKFSILKFKNESDGNKYFLSLLLELYSEEENPNNLVLFDEPELHLHPGYVVDIRNNILNTLKLKKYIALIATHSIFMIDKNKLDECIYLENQNNATLCIQDFSNWNEGNYPDIIKQSFGVNVFEQTYLKQNSILVEGESDQVFFDHIFKLINIECSIFVGGGNNILVTAKTLKEIMVKNYFENNFFIIVDNDNEGQKYKDKLLNELKFDEKHIITINQLTQNEDDKTLECVYTTQFNTNKNKVETIKNTIENKGNYKFDTKKIDNVKKYLLKILPQR